MRTRWIVLHVAEPLPVDDRSPTGPFYAAGSEWRSLCRSAKDVGTRQHVEQQAQALRARGFTATVREETK